MAKPAVSRDAFRGLFALYWAKAHHDHKAEAENCLLTLFGSAEYIPDRLLQQWSEKADLLGPKTVGRWSRGPVKSPAARGTTMRVIFSTHS